MECNKDDAHRAKKIAEEKMVRNDFEGARNMALKAKRLFPDLDNISQLITVCDIHCAAQKKIFGGGNDLYGILQVDIVADEATIRKQYRKLALLLHPDKNKFPGAEAAFKLIGEANTTLSDKAKRSAYDIKCKQPAGASTTKIQNSQRNQTSYAGQQNNSKTVPVSQFNGVNHGQKPTSNPNTQSTFWTHCPYCKVKFQYLREFVNRALKCQHCLHLFIGNETGPAGGPTFVPKQKKGGEFPSSSATKKTEKTKIKQERVTKAKADSVRKPVESETAKSTNKKRGRKKAEESTETISDKKKAAGGGVSGGLGAKVKEATGDRVNGGGELTPKKRTKLSKSSNGVKDIKKEDVSGCEGSDKKKAAGGSVCGGLGAKVKEATGGRVNGGGELTPKKRSKLSNSSNDVKDIKKEDVSGCEGSDKKKAAGFGLGVKEKQATGGRVNGGGELTPKKRSKLSKSSNDVKDFKKEDVSGCEDKSDVTRVDVSTPKRKPEVKLEDVTPENQYNSDSEPEFVACPDQEFTDFDKNKEEHCFAVGQIWACYDSVDSMPRFYAKIKKIYSSKFRMQITWFEPDPDNVLEMKWAEAELPVACGDYVLGETEETSDRLMFSHQIVAKKGAGKSSYFISPQKGEIWALYKNWDIKWSLDPENHTKFKFDIVEIIRVDTDVIYVGSLLKVKGFAAVFQRSTSAKYEHMIPSSERFRFSHRIPSAKLTGTERAGVPAGSFELDMASLPDDLEDYCTYVSNNLDTAHEEKVRLTKNLANTPKKHTICVDKDMLKLRRSPRGLKSPKQENTNA